MLVFILLITLSCASEYEDFSLNNFKDLLSSDKDSDNNSLLKDKKSKSSSGTKTKRNVKPKKTNKPKSVKRTKKPVTKPKTTTKPVAKPKKTNKSKTVTKPRTTTKSNRKVMNKAVKKPVNKKTTVKPLTKRMYGKKSSVVKRTTKQQKTTITNKKSSGSMVKGKVVSKPLVKKGSKSTRKSSVQQKNKKVVKSNAKPTLKKNKLNSPFKFKSANKTKVQNKKTLKPMKKGLTGKKSTFTNTKKQSTTTKPLSTKSKKNIKPLTKGLSGKKVPTFSVKGNKNVTSVSQPTKSTTNTNTKIINEKGKKGIEASIDYKGDKLSTNSQAKFTKDGNGKTTSFGIEGTYQANKNVSFNAGFNFENKYGQKTKNFNFGTTYTGSKFNGNAKYNKKLDPMGKSSLFQYNAEYKPNKNFTFGISGSKENKYGKTTNTFNGKIGFVGEEKLKKADLSYNKVTGPNGVSSNIHYDANYNPDNKWGIGIDGDISNKNGEKTNKFDLTGHYKYKKLDANLNFNHIKDGKGKSNTLSGKFDYKASNAWRVTGDGFISNKYGQKSNGLNVKADYKSTNTTGNISAGFKNDEKGKSNYVSGNIVSKVNKNLTLSANGKISNDYGKKTTDINGQAVFNGDKLQANLALGHKKDTMGVNSYIQGNFSYKANNNWTFTGNGKANNQYGKRSNEFGFGVQHTGPKLSASALYQQTNNAAGKNTKVNVDGTYRVNNKTVITGNLNSVTNNGKRDTGYGIGIKYNPDENSTINANFKHNGVTGSNVFGIGGNVKNDKLDLSANAEFGKNNKKADLTLSYNPSDKFSVDGKVGYSYANGHGSSNYGVDLHYKPDEKWDISAGVSRSNEGTTWSAKAAHKMNKDSSWFISAEKGPSGSPRYMGGLQISF
ncbi:hypothetical protein EHI8A_012100 [Entamoeba histolytica HM-1:IMSS-B]|uniref:Uncharacterized protein n=6 Tax=Entamoeba histolytica TaxID=5759 RepID=C4M6F8_ENTH1|nr:hypothetical protein EHI_099780 [Entamoeba histolytica HM-1:IMSS]EMD49513.1 Hypothetical protein EHI5A_026850 [Entamoeba histolytica KU27]EMH75162.1 hypothetical protein EHI8A_012100 [Entamoeba histolytica HM-1:IMSS-B]EMS13735.1 hypothetical protein KM1_028380 [Entamoeba histolytica HM-3:IMSS]ENY63013.1 hypothetical protein EHI7A_012180 [Entamoeba histolytica HM-1:IMSS-A]GAT97076.1 hypothetical protein CL6EHI_099780 [Entamoeba histolytica]|eukprot:XP_651275.1 hypothetical protein EHI_099780 [Entamoeba histolytica HM-1:IMSS]